jgi:hypothetical protein
LSGMPHITDQLWQSVLPVINNAKWVSAISFKEHEVCNIAFLLYSV